jgi:hypothetical protein
METFNLGNKLIVSKLRKITTALPCVHRQSVLRRYNVVMPVPEADLMSQKTFSRSSAQVTSSGLSYTLSNCCEVAYAHGRLPSTWSIHHNISYLLPRCCKCDISISFRADANTELNSMQVKLVQSHAVSI